MKFINKLSITIFILLSCNHSEIEYVKNAVNNELQGCLKEFKLRSSNNSSFTFGSDFDEMFVLQIDSNNLSKIIESIKTKQSIQYIGDSILQYDRQVSETEYVSIHLNIKNKILTYSHWSD